VRLKIDKDQQETEYAVRFWHMKPEDTKRWLTASELSDRVYRVTACYIYKVFGEKAEAANLAPSVLMPAKDGRIFVPISHGHALCSTADQFSKMKGRKLALQRALRFYKFDKPTRTKFWQAYREQDGKGEAWRTKGESREFGRGSTPL
jgi:hypothetical protein